MRVAIIAALVMVGATGAGVGEEQVLGQAASPSVRAAARLKYNPPRNWIRHYLPDDRYKLMGGTWKVVSTETDTMYYPAWAPEMLSQSAGIVIGFPSAAAAEEAGYRRSKYPMESPLLGLTGRPVAAPPVAPVPVAPGAPASPIGGFSLPTSRPANLNRGRARRIVLSDGVSTTVLPTGWSHTRHTVPAGTRAGSQEQRLDFFFPGLPDPNVVQNPRNARFIVLGAAVMPNNINAEELFSTRALNRLNRAIESSGRVNTAATRSLNTGMRVARFGNISGISIAVPIPEFGRTIPIAMGGRGSKAFFLIDTTRGARGGSSIISNFRGR
jgi:hypothetical protein